jgi:hypothetical protein
MVNFEHVMHVSSVATLSAHEYRRAPSERFLVDAWYKLGVGFIVVPAHPTRASFGRNIAKTLCRTSGGKFYWANLVTSNDRISTGLVSVAIGRRRLEADGMVIFKASGVPDRARTQRWPWVSIAKV